MHYWTWLLKWFLALSAAFLLVVLLVTWRPAIQPATDLPASHGGAALDDPVPRGTPDTPANSPVAVDAASATAQPPPYALVFKYGFLPFLSNGQPSTLQADFYYARIGDVTGDNRHDLVSYGIVEDPVYDEMLYVYPQLSNGTLGAPIRQPVSGVIGLALADMNNDGREDVVITQMQGISLGILDDAGKLQIIPFASTIDDKQGMDIAADTLDLDSDGNLDVLAHVSVWYAEVGDSSLDRRSRFRVFYGDGNGGVRGTKDFAVFGTESHDYGDYDSETASAVVLKDLNADGYPDIAMAAQRYIFGSQGRSWVISTYRNNKAGGFLAPQVINAYTSEFSAALDRLGVGDFNGDGRQDLAAAPTTMQSYAYLFLQTSSGTFLQTSSYDRSVTPLVMPLIGVDLDTDGKDDLLMGHSNWGQFGYLLQKNGLLGEETPVGLLLFAGERLDGGIDWNSLATGDLNSDGCKDVAVAVVYNGLQVFQGRNCIRRYFLGGPNPARPL